MEFSALKRPDSVCSSGRILPRPKSNFDVQKWKQVYDHCDFNSDNNFDENEMSLMKVPVKLQAQGTPEESEIFGDSENFSHFEDNPSRSKRCNLHPSLKKTCGWPKITDHECLAIGCCYFKDTNPEFEDNNPGKEFTLMWFKSNSMRIAPLY